MIPAFKAAALACSVMAMPQAFPIPGQTAPRVATAQKTEVRAADREPSKSGIAGQVRIKPVRPHATIGVPNLAPYQGKFAVLDLAGHEVTSFETDASGSFRIALPPGKYLLRPQTSGTYPRTSERTVVVAPNRFTQVEVVYDSGIR